MTKAKEETKTEGAGIKSALKALEQKYGKGVVTMGGIKELRKVPSGIVSLDRLLAGGFPRGRWFMLYGSKGTCKSTLCQRMVGNFQRNKEPVLVIDAENTWEKDYAVRLGMDPETCYYANPSTAEEMGTIVNDFAPHVGLIVVDSVVAVSSVQELEAKDGLESNSMALLPRKLSQFFRMTTPVVGKSDAVVILVNQARTNFSGHHAFEDYSGGNALSHALSGILHTSRGSKSDWPSHTIGGKTVYDGFLLNWKLEKTKISSTEMQSAAINYYYTEPHFRIEDDIFKVAVLEGIIDKGGGGYYSFGDTKIQGGDSFVQELMNNKKLFEAIKKEVLK